MQAFLASAGYYEPPSFKPQVLFIARSAGCRKRSIFHFSWQVFSRQFQNDQRVSVVERTTASTQMKATTKKSPEHNVRPSERCFQRAQPWLLLQRNSSDRFGFTYKTQDSMAQERGQPLACINTWDWSQLGFAPFSEDVVRRAHEDKEQRAVQEQIEQRKKNMDWSKQMFKELWDSANFEQKA